MNKTESKKKITDILNEEIDYVVVCESSVKYVCIDHIADALIENGLTVRQKAKWLWDYEDDAPKCSVCGKRAMYQPHEKENGEKLCFITLSLFCPHCGAEMENEMCEEDTEEYREREEFETFP